MSVIVKGMEMPTECRKCPFNEFGTMSGETWCGVNNVTLAKNFEAINFDGRPDWCPIIALPDHHGRLVDADALIEQMEADAEHMDEPYARMMYSAAISDARHTPTIVESEGENADHN